MILRKANTLQIRPSNVFRAASAFAAMMLVSIVNASGQNYIYQQLYAFGADTKGYAPEGALVQGKDGNFYGTCADGGQSSTNNSAGGYGTVFKMTPDGALTTLAWFGYTNGAYPSGAMIQATDGNFYGTAGGIFKMTPAGVLTGNPGASDVIWDILQGTNGYLYGADAYYREVFWGTLDDSYYDDLPAPGTPSGGLIQASDGNFYGLTSDGGTSGFGTAYKLTPGGALTTLVSFGGTNIGRWPYGMMLQASDGNLYGVCDSPEQVFKLTLDGTLTTFAVFGTNAADWGSNPNGGIIEANDGNFYGTTFEGGTNAGAIGTVFKITPQGLISSIIVFSSNRAYPGSGPMAGLVQGSDGNLYGTCAYGGDYGGGNIFRIIMPGPQLSLGHIAGKAVLTWRTNYVGFTLQTSDGLNPPNWIDCTNSSTVSGGLSGGQFCVTNGLSSGSRFFRLRK